MLLLAGVLYAAALVALVHALRSNLDDGRWRDGE